MSVTFWCPEAPRKQIPCPYCQWARDGGYDHDGMCEPAGRCSGFRDVSEAPETNFSNTNARTVLELLGFLADDSIYGESDAGTMRQAIFKARNSDRSSAVVAGYELEPGHAGTAVVEDNDGISRIERRGPRVISFGNTDADTLRRLASLEVLAIWAQENDQQISWG